MKQATKSSRQAVISFGLTLIACVLLSASNAQAGVSGKTFAGFGQTATFGPSSFGTGTVVWSGSSRANYSGSYAETPGIGITLWSSSGASGLYLNYNWGVCIFSSAIIGVSMSLEQGEGIWYTGAVIATAVNESE